jgi:ketosteroid isomerase-like protein
MAPDNVQVLRDSLAAWNRGDLDGWLEYMGPGFEYRMARLFLGMEPLYRGREEMRMFWSTFREPWETITLEVDQIVDLGDRVVMLHTFRGTGKESGVEVAQQYASLVSFTGGLVTEMVGYGGDWAAARAAAGLD